MSALSEGISEQVCVDLESEGSGRRESRVRLDARGEKIVKTTAGSRRWPRPFPPTSPPMVVIARTLGSSLAVQLFCQLSSLHSPSPLVTYAGHSHTREFLFFWQWPLGSFGPTTIPLRARPILSLRPCPCLSLSNLGRIARRCNVVHHSIFLPSVILPYALRPMLIGQESWCASCLHGCTLKIGILYPFELTLSRILSSPIGPLRPPETGI